MTKGRVRCPGSTLGCDFSSFFLIETLSIAGQEFSKCLRNGSDRLRKGQLRRLPVAQCHDSLGLWISRCGSVWTSVTGFWIPYQWNVDSGLQSLAGFRNP